MTLEDLEAHERFHDARTEPHHNPAIADVDPMFTLNLKDLPNERPKKSMKSFLFSLQGGDHRSHFGDGSDPSPYTTKSVFLKAIHCLTQAPNTANAKYNE